MIAMLRIRSALFLIILVSIDVRPTPSSSEPSPRSGILPSLVRDNTGGWNSPEARALIESARMRRAEPRIGAGLYDYRARAEGHIYFFLDQNSSSEETLVRADQIGRAHV